jgi:hypothetical protein
MYFYAMKSMNTEIKIQFDEAMILVVARYFFITLNRYVSDHGYNGYKAVCQRKLLQSSRIEWQLARNYPPCLLEWRANRKRVNMALQIYFADGKFLLIHWS